MNIGAAFFGGFVEDEGDHEESDNNAGYQHPDEVGHALRRSFGVFRVGSVVCVGGAAFPPQTPLDVDEAADGSQFLVPGTVASGGAT